MRFSLILCTLNRTKEVAEFLHTLTLQSLKDFELFIVDQNTDNRLKPILEKYENKLNIHYLTSKPGLSRARNKALPLAKGDIIAFPDDDCLYPENVLQKVSDFFDLEKHDGLTVQMKNSLDNGINYGNKNHCYNMQLKDVFGTASWVIFIKRNVFEKTGGFDESLGLGSGTFFIGGEDYEIIAKAIKNKFTFKYNSKISVLHPAVDLAKTNRENKANSRKRIIGAGASDYYILIKHFSLTQRLNLLLHNFAGIAYHSIKQRNINTAINHINRIKGMLKAIYLLRTF